MVSRLARGASRPFLVGLGAAVSTFGAARAESPAESADAPRAPAVRPLQAHVVFRHGPRTPIRLPEGFRVDTPWEVVDDGPRVGEGVVGSTLVRTPHGAPLPELTVDWELRKPGHESSTAGRLTKVGFERMRGVGATIGRDLVARGLLRGEPSDLDDLYVRSSGLSRTIRSAEAVVRGMVPAAFAGDRAPLLPVVTVPEEEEYLYPNTRSCPRIGDVLRRGHRAYRSREAATHPALRASLAEALGVDPATIHFYRVRDAVRALEAAGLPVPFVLSPALQQELDVASVDQLTSLFGLAEGESSPDHLVEMVRMLIGPLLEELALRLEQAESADSLGIPLGARGAVPSVASAPPASVSGAERGAAEVAEVAEVASALRQQALFPVDHADPFARVPRVLLYSAHDTTLIPLLLALGIYDRSWPSFGANVRIELLRIDEASSASSASSSSSSSPVQVRATMPAKVADARPAPMLPSATDSEEEFAARVRAAEQRLQRAMEAARAASGGGPPSADATRTAVAIALSEIPRLRGSAKDRDARVLAVERAMMRSLTRSTAASSSDPAAAAAAAGKSEVDAWRSLDLESLASWTRVASLLDRFEQLGVANELQHKEHEASMEEVKAVLEQTRRELARWRAATQASVKGAAQTNAEAVQVTQHEERARGALAASLLDARWRALGERLVRLLLRVVHKADTLQRSLDEEAAAHARRAAILRDDAAAHVQRVHRAAHAELAAQRHDLELAHSADLAGVLRQLEEARATHARALAETQAHAAHDAAAHVQHAHRAAHAELAAQRHAMELAHGVDLATLLQRLEEARASHALDLAEARAAHAAAERALEAARAAAEAQASSSESTVQATLAAQTQAVAEAEARVAAVTEAATRAEEALRAVLESSQAGWAEARAALETRIASLETSASEAAARADLEARHAQAAETRAAEIAALLQAHALATRLEGLETAAEAAMRAEAQAVAQAAAQQALDAAARAAAEERVRSLETVWTARRAEMEGSVRELGAVVVSLVESLELSLAQQTTLSHRLVSAASEASEASSVSEASRASVEAERRSLQRLVLDLGASLATALVRIEAFPAVLQQTLAREATLQRDALELRQGAELAALLQRLDDTRAGHEAAVAEARTTLASSQARLAALEAAAAATNESVRAAEEATRAAAEAAAHAQAEAVRDAEARVASVLAAATASEAALRAVMESSQAAWAQARGSLEERIRALEAEVSTTQSTATLERAAGQVHAARAADIVQLLHALELASRLEGQQAEGALTAASEATRAAQSANAKLQQELLEAQAELAAARAAALAAQEEAARVRSQAAVAEQSAVAREAALQAEVAALRAVDARRGAAEQLPPVPKVAAGPRYVVRVLVNNEPVRLPGEESELVPLDAFLRRLRPFFPKDRKRECLAKAAMTTVSE